jgi:hypothetical protein
MESTWRKSSYSQGGADNCVEMVRDQRGLKTRDSKAPNGAVLTFADSAASAFLSEVKAGGFTR